MIEKDGNLFDSDAAYLAHGVNCDGVMGAGIAKGFRDQFKRNYDVYRVACDKGALVPGGFLVVPERRDNGRLALIANLASQNKPGADASYEWLVQSLLAFAKEASNEQRLRLWGGTVAIPEIGCGIGGLEWPVVEIILKVVEHAYPDIEFEVWHYV